MSGPAVRKYKLWDFLSERGENVILEWVKDERLSSKDRAVLNQRFDRLVQIDFRDAIATQLLAGPIQKSQHIYKLKAYGQVMLRPMLCRGPIDNEREYTLLAGAIEKGWKLTPGALEKSIKNRETVIEKPERRCVHVRIP
jgi:hypothetical protein